MVLYAINLLVLFMSFAGNQNNIIGTGHANGHFNGLPAVGYGKRFFSGTHTQPCFHIGQYLLRIFGTRIVAGKNDFVAVFASHFTHYRPFGFIAIAAAAYYRNYLLVAGF